MAVLPSTRKLSVNFNGSILPVTVTSTDWFRTSNSTDAFFFTFKWFDGKATFGARQLHVKVIATVMNLHGYAHGGEGLTQQVMGACEWMHHILNYITDVYLIEQSFTSPVWKLKGSFTTFCYNTKFFRLLTMNCWWFVLQWKLTIVAILHN